MESFYRFLSVRCRYPVGSAVLVPTQTAYLYLFARLEYQHVGDQVVEKPRDEQCGKVAIDDVPLENLLEDEQEDHFHEEARPRRQVEYKEPDDEIPCGTTADAALPDPKVGTHEVAQHGKLETDNRRKDIGPEVAVKDEIGAYPQHQCVNPCPKQAADNELQVDAQFQHSSFHNLLFIFEKVSMGLAWPRYGGR